MLNDNILYLRVAFDGLPDKGLIFWSSLLLPEKIPYDELLKKAFSNLLSDPFDEKKLLSEHYQEIVKNLKHLRDQVLIDPQIKAEIEEIRDAIIETTVHAIVINQMKKDLEKS